MTTIGYLDLGAGLDGDFDRARRGAFVRDVFARLRGERRGLLSFEEAGVSPGRGNRIYRGRGAVEVERIVGSVGRARDFDRDFLPVKRALKERWRLVNRAFRRARGLPPVVLYRVGEFYFVVDGNHRVSVARYHGVEWIDAEVTEFRGETPSLPTADRKGDPMPTVQDRRKNKGTTTTRPFRTVLAMLAAAAVAGLALAQASLAAPAIVEREAAGANAFAVEGALNDFREDLGGTNNGVGNSFPDGRREINWDGVPDNLASPNAMPADLFRGRGAVFSTPVGGFQVSADFANPTNTVREFGNFAGEFVDEFDAFSPERLFAAPNSPVTEVAFFVPGTTTPATVDGFGAVFTDVDRADSSTIEYLGSDRKVLFEQRVPATVGDETFSFAGATFDTARIARVRITSGEKPLDDFAGGNEDFVAMDDFIFGEPQTKPEITPISPAPGSQIQSTSPTVRTRITDAQTDLAKADIKLFVDGRAKNFSYDAAGTDLLSSPQKNLSRGGHQVRIVALDEAGLSATRTWNFRVLGAR